MELIKTQVCELANNMQRLTGSVRYDDGVVEEYLFEIPIGYKISDSGNPWLACLLPLAVTIGEDLKLSLPVEQVLLDASDNLIRLWKNWYPNLHEINVSAEIGVVTKVEHNSATFFSAGVDSYFTAIRHPHAKSMIITLGFDMPYQCSDKFKAHFERITKSAKECGGVLIPTATNIRETRWSKCHWELLGFGPALTTIALLFEKHFNEVYIPSSNVYKSLHPWASHPLIDSLFTTHNLHFIHDSCGYSRIEKIKLISNYDHILKSLHVCFRGKDGLGQDQYNCCNCEKCYRTMIVLEILGKLKQAFLFKESKVDLNKISLIYGNILFLYELHDFAVERKNTKVAKALKASIKRSKRLNRLKKLNKIPFIWRISSFFYNKAIAKSLI